MADFNQEAPPKRITDPDGVGADPNFPAHLHRFVANVDPDNVPDQTLVVAWVGPGRKKTPIYNEIMDVANQKALDDAVAEGWSTKPELEPAKKKAPRTPAADPPKTPPGDDKK